MNWALPSMPRGSPKMTRTVPFKSKVQTFYKMVGSVIGLDNSGKSTLLNHFKPEEQQNQNIGK